MLFVIAVRYISGIDSPPSDIFSISTIASHIFRGIYFIGLSTAYWFALSTLRNQKKIAELEIRHDMQQLKAAKERSELEKNLLQAKNKHLLTQLNPHLLFNTLNFVYNSVRRVSPDAANGVALLADIMNHALRGTDKDGKIPLCDEVDHIRKITELCRLRYEGEAHLNLLIEGESAGKRIPPLILVTFVENVIKHGDLTNPEHPARITLKIRDKEICLSTSNLKKNADISIGHQIGIRNAQQRLAELYPKEAITLSIEDVDNLYTVHLSISNSL